MLYSFVMLQFLKIKNLAVIEDIEVEFTAGLNLFTGETGAGKSIIIDALGLLMGHRTYTDLIRTGAEQMSVEGVFTVPGNNKAHSILKNAGFEIEDEKIIIKRELRQDGRSRGLINGSFATTRVMKNVGKYILEIHGQHQHQRLLDRDTHLLMLDGFADAEVLREEVQKLYDEMESVRKQLEAIRQDEQLKAQKIDILEFQIKELEEAQLEPGEEEKLEQEKQILSNAEFLFRNAMEAYSALYENEENVISVLESIKKNLARISDISPEFSEDFERIESYIYNLQDTAMKLQSFSEEAAPDANRLEIVESRLAMIRRLSKKYGSSISDMLGFLENARKELEELNTSEEREAELEARLNDIQKEYVSAAEKLSNIRKSISPELTREVEQNLSMLAMERTRFDVAIKPLSSEHSFELDGRKYFPGPYGLDYVEFFIAPNVGEELRPLIKIASGGELSRLMLALESVFKGKELGRTLIFDEVDSGIGGRVAEIVGKKLRMLSYKNQIICVTHLPQVAAYANTHFSISKSIKFNRTFTDVHKLDSEERVKELARMLGGLKITETTMQQAREFLNKV